MKKEIDNIALKAINKFFYFSQNYVCDHAFYSKGKTLYVPKFITDCKWSYGTAHIAEKWWNIVTNGNDSYGVMNRFYAELDNDCRITLLNWVLENYKDEIKLKTNEEV